jgi:hypothetical protein
VGTIANRRNILKTLGLALAATPAVAFVGMILITLIGALDDSIMKLQRAGHWWVILIAAYFVALIYLIYEPIIRRGNIKKKWVDALILYWQAKIVEEGKPEPSSREIKDMRSQFEERIKLWVQSDPKLWSLCCPDEEYPPNVFGIVDGATFKKAEQLALKEKED